MIYIKIPIKSELEGKQIAEEIFGAMMWNDEEENVLLSYPYDGNNPVIIDKDNL